MPYKALIITLLLFAIKDDDSLLPQNGKELIYEIYNRYSGKFFKTLSFSQHLIRYEKNMELSREIMHEAYAVPGKLILKFKSWESGDGVLFRSDSIYSFMNGKMVSQEKRIHDLLLLCFDIYNIAPDVTIQKLRMLNYNLDLIQKIKQNGVEMYLIGDVNENCFWFDAKSLMLKKLQVKNTNRARTVKLSDFKIINSIPIATKIEFFDSGNNLEMVEMYFDVTPFRELNDNIFIPANFIQSKW